MAQRQIVGTDAEREPTDSDFWKKLIRGLQRYGTPLGRRTVETARRTLQPQGRFNANDAPHDRLPSLVGIGRGRRYRRQAERACC